VSDRYHRTKDRTALLAMRAFHDGEEARAWRETHEARQAESDARVAYEHAQQRHRDAEQEVARKRDWFARRLMEALGLPPADRSFDEVWAYQDADEVVIGVRRKDPK
jgi:hypothetical protein